MKHFFVLLPVLATSLCFAEYTVSHKAQDKALRELTAAVDRSDSVLFARLLEKYPLDTFTQEQHQRLIELAQKTVSLRKRATRSLFSSGKDTVYAAISAALACYGLKLVHTSALRDQESLLTRVARGAFGGLLAHVSLECFIDNINVFNAHRALDRARAIQARLELQADK